MSDESGPEVPLWLRWLPRWVQRPQEPGDPGKRFHEPGGLRRLGRLFLPGRVSRIHLYEAQERYLTLLRMLEYHAQLPCAPAERQVEKDPAITMCRKILREANVLLTRRQNDLNFLWREMTRVHIMLLEKVLPDTLLPAQLDFCREEARRLAVPKDPEVNEMLQRLAEATQENDVATNRERMIRVIRALIERFTSIRTGRIHQQFVNIRTYQVSLVVLVPILVLLIANRDLVVGGPEGGAAAAPPAAGFASGPPGWPGFTCGEEEAASPCVVRLPGRWLKFLYAGARYLLGHNILAFVFFAGIAGGFFSVVIRLRNRELIPGEDAYFVWYVLSKPFVGALGAVILFVLLKGDYLSVEILKGMVEPLQRHEHGPITFGFGFLAGFPERVVFPEFR